MSSTVSRLADTSATDAFGRVAIRDAHRQPAGLVHGGVYASIAEALATGATIGAIPDTAVAGIIALHGADRGSTLTS